MSCDWSIFCRTCNEEHPFSDANHAERLMRHIIASAPQIAALVPLIDLNLSPWEIELGCRFGSIDPQFFREHLGHDLVPRSEYGNFDEGAAE